MSENREEARPKGQIRRHREHVKKTLGLTWEPRRSLWLDREGKSVLFLPSGWERKNER